MKHFYTLFFAILMLFSVSLTDAKAKVFNPQSFYLPNGMQVVVIENHRAPIVSHMLWYKTGAADETAGKSGLAHFFEHLMFRGTPSLPDGLFSKRIKRLGGNDNAFTSQDYTAYFQNIPKQHLETVMMMEADRMVNLNTADDIIRTEQNVIIEERKQRVDNSPGAILREHVNTALFANHPYSIPVIGWMHEIKSLSPDDVRAFYKKWYAPNNAILMIAGDVTLDEIKPLAEKHYGVLTPANLPDMTLPTPAPITADHHISYSDSRVGTPVLSINYRAPRGSHALQILTNSLTGNPTARLYKKLVIDDKIAIDVSFYYNSTTRGPGTASLTAIPAPEVDLKTLEQKIMTALKHSLETLSNDDVTRAKQRLVDSATFEQDSLSSAPNIIGRALTTGFSLESVESWPEDIQNTSIADIKAAGMQAFFGETKPVIATLTPPDTQNEETDHE